MKIALLAAAAVLAVPAAFAQSTTATTTTTVSAPPVVTISPANSPVSDWPMRGAVAQEMVTGPIAVTPQGSNTSVLGASATPVVRYWWNVPSDINTRADFRRYRGLL